jgi:hypothetical protein
VVVRISAERIVEEAEDWSLSDQVVLQVLPTGDVRVTVQSDRARRFVQHLASLEPSRPASP